MVCWFTATRLKQLSNVEIRYFDAKRLEMLQRVEMGLKFFATSATGIINCSSHSLTLGDIAAGQNGY